MSQNEELPSVIEYDVDISEQEAPPPLPLREYLAQIKGVKRKLSQRNTQYAEVQFYISPNEYPADFTEGDPDGTTLYFRRVSLENKPQARFQLRRFLEAIGAPMSKRIDINEWVGLEAKVKIEHESYEGLTRSVITQVLAA